MSRFAPRYKMNVVNPDKNIVSLSPTAGTYAKAFAPALVFYAVAGIVYFVQSRKDDALFPEFDENDLDPEPK